MTELLLLIAILGSGAQGPAPTADKVLEFAVKQRQAITKFSGTFHFDLQNTNQKSPSGAFQRRFWMDGVRLRQDRLRGEETVAIECRHCEKEGEFISLKNGGKGKVALEYGKTSAANFKSLLFTDPRVVGLELGPSGLLHAYKLDSMLGRKDRVGTTLEKTKWKGDDAYVVRFSLTTPVTVKYAYWIVPTMDYSVVAIEAERQSNGEKYTYSLKTEMQRYGKPGTWFPKTYVAENLVGGKLAWRETMKVSEVTINEPLAADAFKLRGMGIPPETSIQGSALPDKNKRYEWDGKAIIELPQPKAKEQPKESSEAPAGTPPRGLLVAAGVGFGLVGVVSIGLFLRKGRSL